MRIVTIAIVLLCGCAPDGVRGSDGHGGSDGGGAGGPDADVGDGPCDMAGVWVVEQHTTSIALSTDQNTTNWYYWRVTQEGDQFTITEGLNCGFVVDGTTTVTLGDDTLEALARNEALLVGRQGSYAVDGDGCAFHLERSYNLRGADKAAYLTDHWQLGDPDLALSEFPDMPSAPPGMEDWDADNMDGITLISGLGGRYVSQRDWNEHDGRGPQFAAAFGDEESITVFWDSQEGISEQTSPILRTTATPAPPGWARYARADGLDIVDGDELATCRNVQQLAQEIWP
jgi:hypothetical protein